MLSRRPCVEIGGDACLRLRFQSSTCDQRRSKGVGFWYSATALLMSSSDALSGRVRSTSVKSFCEITMPSQTSSSATYFCPGRQSARSKVRTQITAWDRSATRMAAAAILTPVMSRMPSRRRKTFVPKATTDTTMAIINRGFICQTLSWSAVLLAEDSEVAADAPKPVGTESHSWYGSVVHDAQGCSLNRAISMPLNG